MMRVTITATLFATLVDTTVATTDDRIATSYMYGGIAHRALEDAGGVPGDTPWANVTDHGQLPPAFPQLEDSAAGTLPPGAGATLVDGGAVFDRDLDDGPHFVAASCTYDWPQTVAATAARGDNFPADFNLCLEMTQGPCATKKVCSQDDTVELTCDEMVFHLDGEQLSAPSVFIGYMTHGPLSAHVAIYPMDCVAPVAHFSGPVLVETDTPQVEATQTVTGIIPMNEATYWCRPNPDSLSYYVGEQCAVALPQDGHVGFKLRPTGGFIAVPTDCQWSVPGSQPPVAALDVLAGSCPTEGLAEVQFEDPTDSSEGSTTWVNFKTMAPANAYSLIFDANDATHGALMLHLHCSYAVVPHEIAWRFMCAEDTAGRRMLQQDMGIDIKTIDQDVPFFQQDQPPPSPSPPTPMPTPPTETYTIEPDTIEPGEASKTEQNNILILLAVAVAVAVAIRRLCKTGQDAATKDADTKDFASQVDSNGGVLGGSVGAC